MEEFEDDEIVKKIMHVMREAPHGTIYTYEGLEMILIMAAYDQDISVAFIDDGVYALKKGQNTEDIEIKLGDLENRVYTADYYNQELDLTKDITIKTTDTDVTF